MSSKEYKPIETTNTALSLKGVIEFIVELIKVIVICASIIILVRWFLFQPFYVKGSSMEPNFYDGEYLIIFELPYRFPKQLNAFSENDRGKAIIFHPPNEPKQFYIKRIIALPGERVKIDNNKVIIFNDKYREGVVLVESYIGEEVETFSGGFSDVTLGEDEIYVMGDNRPMSLDSRRLGAVKITSVIGEPFVRGWPLERFGLVKKPEY